MVFIVKSFTKATRNSLHVIHKVTLMSFVETFENRMPNKLPVHIHSLGKKQFSKADSLLWL